MAGRQVVARRAGGSVARIAAAATVAIAVAGVAWLFFAGGSSYTVTAEFLNASQLVEGNEVRIGGVAVGSVADLDLGPHALARVEMEIDSDHAPLDAGTRAVIRQQSLSGIANRYVDLQLPLGESGERIPDGGVIDAENAQAAVELDQLFETLDDEARQDLQGVLEGFARMIDGKAEEANAGYRYLPAALSTSRRLFAKLSADTLLLERFVVDSARLVSTLASRRGDLAALVGNLDATTRAASADKRALVEAIDLLPDFMRRANTTFVNLRAALDDVDPLVQASEPVARELRDFLPDLQALAEDAVPATRDLSRTIRDRGELDDVVELLRTFPPLSDVAVEENPRNGRLRPGAFPATAEALVEASPIIALGRPYTPDFFGWADDFSHTGLYDAIGGYSRTQIYLNPLSVSIPQGSLPPELEPLEELIGELQEDFAESADAVETEQYRRCPGASEAPTPDGSNVFSEQQRHALDCLEEDRAVEEAGG